MVERLLPSMRHLVSRRLCSEGFSQSRVSSMLGVTQASVSHYLTAGTERPYSVLASLSLDREETDRYVSLLSEDLKRNPLDSVDTLTTLWVELLGRGLVCPAHRAMYPSLAQCDVCVRQFGAPRKTPEIVGQVARAVKMLEDTPNFALVMPEVSVNIASLEGDSQSIDDVVAVPGRIVRVRNTPRAMSQPERGASRHMAKILLLVRKRMPEYRAALNLKWDLRMARALKKLGLRSLALGSYVVGGSEDPTVEALTSRLLQTRERFDAVVDPGGKGIEPSLYLFGRTAPDVALTAARITEIYSSSAG